MQTATPHAPDPAEEGAPAEDPAEKGPLRMIQQKRYRWNLAPQATQLPLPRVSLSLPIPLASNNMSRTFGNA